MIVPWTNFVGCFRWTIIHDKNFNVTHVNGIAYGSLPDDIALKFSADYETWLWSTPDLIRLRVVYKNRHESYVIRAIKSPMDLLEFVANNIDSIYCVGVA